MPIYEYFCHECKTRIESYRAMDERHTMPTCSKGHATELGYSVPSLAIWNSDRAFPNAVKSGDGKFKTKAAYEMHLKMNDMAETSTDGRIYRPHGNKVIRGS